MIERGHRQLKVWQKGMDLAAQIHRQTIARHEELYGLVAMRRAASRSLQYRRGLMIEVGEDYDDVPRPQVSPKWKLRSSRGRFDEGCFRCRHRLYSDARIQLIRRAYVYARGFGLWTAVTAERCNGQGNPQPHRARHPGCPGSARARLRGPVGGRLRHPARRNHGRRAGKPPGCGAADAPAQAGGGVEHLRAGWPGRRPRRRGAAYLREAAFTTLNRFVALKMLEARGLVQECISRGEQSAGFKEFCGLAPGLVQLPDHGYRLYIESLFDELSTEVKVLFDRRDPVQRCCGRSARPSSSSWTILNATGACRRLGRGRDHRLGLPVLQRRGRAQADARGVRRAAQQPRAGRPQPVLHAALRRRVPHRQHPRPHLVRDDPGPDAPQGAVPVPRPPAHGDLPGRPGEHPHRRATADSRGRRQPRLCRRKNCCDSPSTSPTARSRTRATSGCSTRRAAPCTSASTPSTSSDHLRRGLGHWPRARRRERPRPSRASHPSRSSTPTRTPSSATSRASSSSTTSTASTSTGAPCRSPGFPCGCAPSAPGTRPASSRPTGPASAARTSSAPSRCRGRRSCSASSSSSSSRPTSGPPSPSCWRRSSTA